MHNAEIEVEIERGTSPLINPPETTALAREAAAEAIGTQQVTELTIANMGGEDFSFYLEKVPGCYVRFGSQVPGKEGFPAHSSRFDFDEQALAIGALYYYRVAMLAGMRVAGNT